MVTNEQENGATTWTVADTKNLTIEGERSSGTLIAKASGRIDGSNAREFQDALETFLEGEEASSLVLDLEDLSYISSAGLRVILLVSKKLQKSSAQFGVCSLSVSISEVFQISGFDKIIKTHNTRADALSAING